MPFIIYRNQEIPQIREKRMTFLFPESVLAFIELQPQEKLKLLNVTRAQILSC